MVSQHLLFDFLTIIGGSIGNGQPQE